MYFCFVKTILIQFQFNNSFSHLPITNSFFDLNLFPTNVKLSLTYHIKQPNSIKFLLFKNVFKTFTCETYFFDCLFSANLCLRVARERITFKVNYYFSLTTQVDLVQCFPTKVPERILGVRTMRRKLAKDLNV